MSWKLTLIYYVKLDHALYSINHGMHHLLRIKMNEESIFYQTYAAMVDDVKALAKSCSYMNAERRKKN